MIDDERYETETNIPDFVETRDGKDPDLSVFNFDDTEETTNLDLNEEDDDEYEEDDDYDRPRRKLSTKGILIIVCAVAVLLLVATIAGWVYGIGQHNAYSKIESQYNELSSQVSGLNSQISNLKAENSELQAQIDSTKGDSNSAYSGPGTYEITEESGVNLRDAIDGTVVKLLEKGTILEVSETSEIVYDDGSYIVWAHCQEGWFAVTMADNFTQLAKKN